MKINIDFGAIKDTVSGIAQAGVAQGKKVASIAKLKSDNMAQQDALRKAYREIGKRYYAEHKGNPEEGYAELFAKVDDALAAIAANNAALEEMKETEEVVIDVEMQAGEMPEDMSDYADVPEADATPAEESAPAEEPVPAEDAAPAEEPASAEDQMSNGKADE